MAQFSEYSYRETKDWNTNFSKFMGCNLFMFDKPKTIPVGHKVSYVPSYFISETYLFQTRTRMWDVMLFGGEYDNDDDDEVHDDDKLLYPKRISIHFGLFSCLSSSSCFSSSSFTFTWMHMVILAKLSPGTAKVPILLRFNTSVEFS